MIKSPLFNEIQNYLIRAKQEDQIFIYVPYIKTNILEKLLGGIGNKITVITTWHMNDLVRGSSELELYDFCKSQGIFLYISKNIHLKVYSVNLDTAIVASGNISKNGLMPNGNFEAGILSGKFSNQDRLYLEKIKNDAEFVTDEIFEKYLKRYNECVEVAHPENKFEDIVNVPKSEDNFLISALPMTKNVDDLIKGYDKMNSRLKPSENQIITDCIYHDLSNYEIELGLSKEEFIKKLKIEFFAHPFTQKIDEFIDPEAYFGSIKEWIQDNCTNVPTPGRRELTENVQVLYEWFVKLGDGKYAIDRPNHSQRLYKVGEVDNQNASSDSTNNQSRYENEVLRILNEEGLTINEIKEIYQNSSKKMKLHPESSDPKEQENASESIWHYKNEVDIEIEKRFSLTEEEVGERNSGGKLYRQIVEIIMKLHNNEFIKFWYYKKHLMKGSTSDGIWKLTEKGKQEIQNRGITSNNEISTVENPRLVLFSVSGDASFEHYQDTILDDVDTNNFPTSELKKFSKVRMWGAIDRQANKNRSKWSKLHKGDIILFYRDKKYITKMILDGTEDNSEIAKKIWGEKIDHEIMNVKQNSGETWQLIMYCSPENIEKIDVKFEELNKLLGYKENFMPTRTLDFTTVSEIRLQKLQNKYGSVNNALNSIM